MLDLCIIDLNQDIFREAKEDVFFYMTHYEGEFNNQNLGKRRYILYIFYDDKYWNFHLITFNNKKEIRITVLKPSSGNYSELFMILFLLIGMIEVGDWYASAPFHPRLTPFLSSLLTLKL